MTTEAWPTNAADEFVSRLSDLQAEVRTQVVHTQLSQHLEPGSTVVDIGGGDGRQSILLARLGHDVTIVEPSPDMRTHAARRLGAEAPDVVARVRIVEGSGETASEVLNNQQFGTVLNHGVLPYVDDPVPLVTSLFRVAAPGAVVSIMAKSVTALPIMPAFHGRWSEVIDLFDADRVVNNLGVMTRGDTVENLSRIIEGLGGTVDAWYGVAYFTQGQSISRDTLADEEFAAILAAEVEASHRDPFRQLSNMFHVLARSSK
jgi:SAM-dependent methyltransferase